MSNSGGNIHDFDQRYAEGLQGESFLDAYFSHKYLMYYLPEAGLVYLLALDTIRKMLPEWRRRYPTRPAQNRNYQTLGVLVALHEFEKHAIEVIRVD